MPFKQEIYNREGEKIDSLPFKFEVNLDELDKFHNARILLRPLDPDVVIARYHYNWSEDEIDPYDFKNVEYFEGNYFYNDEADELEIGVHNGFDVALFNMCTLLGLGRIELDDYVEFAENGFAPIHDKVTAMKLTLEEFKQLDGFVSWFKFTKHFILFKGLVIGANYIHEDVRDGDVVPDFKSDKLLRGEKLFLID